MEQRVYRYRYQIPRSAPPHRFCWRRWVCAMCSQVGVYQTMALEAQCSLPALPQRRGLLQHPSSGAGLSVLAGVLTVRVVGAVVAVLQVKYNRRPTW